MVRDLFSWLTGSKSGPASTRDHIINLRMVSKRLSRSQRKLENKEKQMDRKVRTAIQKGDMQSAKLYASDIVRSRKWARGYQSLNSKIEGLIFKLERTDAVQSLAGEMKGVADSLRSASAALNMTGLDDVIQDMQEAMEEVELTGEIMEDSVDLLFENDTDEGEVDNILAEFGAEIGVTASVGLPTPTGATNVSTNASDLKKEIADLRKEED